MVRTNELRSADLTRIEACIIPTIKSCFCYYNFKYSSTDVEEVVSASLLKIARGYDRYDESRSKKAWFQTIAERCALTYMKDETDRRCHQTAMERTTKDGVLYEEEYSDMECADSYEADRELASKQRIQILKRVCLSLGEVQGKALWLKYMGYETEEIEDYLGKKGGALRTSMSRGRSLLKSNPEVLSIAEEVFGRSFSKVA
jgi:DNA-directed RNA polymerase specialized sigma24 family protein